MGHDILGKYLATPIIETEAQRILRFTRDLISEQARWTTGDLINAEGGMCLYGAMMKADGKSDDEIAAQNAYDASDVTAITEACPTVEMAIPFLIAATEEFAAREAEEEGVDPAHRTTLTEADDVMHWNDGSRHHQVLAMLDRAYILAGKADG